MKDIFNIHLTKKVLKDIKKVPIYISLKLQAWIEDVGYRGLSKVRKTPGYHDEPLKGERKKQRSIRLNKHYRAIYVIKKNRVIYFVEIVAVNKHEY